MKLEQQDGLLLLTIYCHATNFYFYFNKYFSNSVRDLLPIPGSSSIVRNIGSDLLSCRDISIRLLSCNILKMFCLISNLYLVNSKLLRSYSRLMVAPDELGPMWLTHRVILDRVHRLLVTLSYFRPDRFVQLLSLIPILILLLYLLVSGCLTSLC